MAAANPATLGSDIASLAQEIGAGGWVSDVLGGVGKAMDVMNKLANPLDTIMSWGIGWLMEHCKPLGYALQWLTGNDAQVSQGTSVWQMVGDSARETATDFMDKVKMDVQDWKGDAADAFRGHAGLHHDGLHAIANSANALGTLVETVGNLVKKAREMVRELLSQFVSALASRIFEWLAIATGTFGLGIGWVIGRVVQMVQQWMSKISKLLNGLLQSLRKLIPIMSKLEHMISDLQLLIRTLSRVKAAVKTVDRML